MSKEISNEELLGAISTGFSAMEKQIGEVKDNVKRLERKMDGVSNRLDAEILRRTDAHADHEKRIKALETGLAKASA